MTIEVRQLVFSRSRGHTPNLAFFKRWGGWSDTPTAMRYATAFRNGEVLAPL